MQKYLVIIVVIICTVLLQAHSIPFWLDHAQSNIGYLWSFTIEFVAIWLWLNKKLILATVASTIIIFVPLMELSKPLVAEIRESSINAKISQLNELDIRQNELLQNKYIKTDWAGTLIKNASQFKEAIDVQKELLLEGKKLNGNFENILIIVLQSIAFVVVLLTQVQALRMLAFQDFEKVENDNFRNLEIPETIETIETIETRADVLLKQIEKYMEDHNLTQASLAKKINIGSSDISKLRNKVTGTGEAISEKKFDELELKFNNI